MPNYMSNAFGQHFQKRLHTIVVVEFIGVLPIYQINTNFGMNQLFTKRGLVITYQYGFK